ncbi:ABC transporter ATP-binding protein [Caldivirga maquilingensis]|uniref:Oligopeptide/dipeptide ABC transporter, ATPase subunit n=1 Tax=Caldivirga maquilingensis (strain ATCC 700844 / DSM 13496 / JCM 10307 / IC-167) TaxID=397948 RepID=A8MCY2_CALMQ|nr:ABC transporter ATP-binding protein [Caldivirga maquilingensis]ABW01638.1 oligopeptide/dipeptide ABC transporter, ATPase subunit [Caldivirga maquilingensis IC-167]
MVLLNVKNVRLNYITTRGIVKALDNVSFSLDEGETIAIVGETGSGKSTLAKVITRSWEENARVIGGEVIFEGVNILGLSEEEFRRSYRWVKIAMVPQGSMNSLNPVLRVVDQMIEPLLLRGIPRIDAIKIAGDALESVGLSKDVLTKYPHQLSGGMKQRVIIAMAIQSRPKLVVLDEPTSALDVMTQANIMNLLKRLRSKFKLSYIFITHDLALASELADKVLVLYAGKVAEFGSADVIYSEPKHPYTQGLMSSVPTLREDKKLSFIPGEVPSLINPPSGCRFHPRCPFAMDICRREEPPLVTLENGHVVACWLYVKG